MEIEELESDSFGECVSLLHPKEKDNKIRNKNFLIIYSPPSKSNDN